uniref:Putative secreted protein ovary overexpressed n=1 Tax=Rhipicephalus microplus TaxID=6941 RepID=A0A6M2DEE9_RHIMP
MSQFTAGWVPRFTFSVFFLLLISTIPPPRKSGQCRRMRFPCAQSISRQQATSTGRRRPGMPLTIGRLLASL